MGGRLLEPDTAGDDRLKGLFSEDLTDMGLDILRKRRPFIKERDQDPEDIQFRIGARADLFDGLEEIIGSLEGKI